MNLSQFRWTRELVSLLAGMLLPLAFAPFHLYPVAIVAVIALLWAIDSGARELRCFYLFYLGAFLVGVSWIYVSINVYGGAPPILAGVMVLLFVACWSLTALPHAYVYSRWIKPSPGGLLFGFAAAWVLAEWFRSWLLTGFPWLLLGYSQLPGPLSGFAPVGSVFAVSLAAVMTSTGLYCAWRWRDWRPLALVACIWAGGALVGQMEFVSPKGTVKVVAVQGNVDQHTKWARNMRQAITQRYLRLSVSAWDADLLVWPEAALTVFRGQAGELLEELDQAGRQRATTLITGIPDVSDEGEFLNTAIALGQGQGSYHKRHLVPFGEYVPLESLLRGLIRLFDLPMSHNAPGPMHQAPLTAGDLQLSLSICYEVVYPELVRSAAPAPDLLVTISNDTWFGSSIGPDQHLQMALMRARENGRSLVRATNNGITVFADHHGTITHALPRDVAASLSGEVALLEGQTPYRRLGHWPVLVLALVIIGLCSLGHYRKRQSFR